MSTNELRRRFFLESTLGNVLVLGWWALVVTAAWTGVLTVGVAMDWVRVSFHLGH